MVMIVDVIPKMRNKIYSFLYVLSIPFFIANIDKQTIIKIGIQTSNTCVVSPFVSVYNNVFISNPLSCKDSVVAILSSWYTA